MRRCVVLVALLLGGCQTEPLEPEPGMPDLAVGDLGAADLSSSALTCNGAAGQVRVTPCCGGQPPLCTPAPDGGCQPPMTVCSFAGSGCYLPCTPVAPYCAAVPPACAGTSGNLCKCIMDHGGTDPCFPSGGSSCDSFSSSTSDHIECLCF